MLLSSKFQFKEFVQWLGAEALMNNPKIEVTGDGKYMFKPPYKIRDRKGLLKLLKQADLKGLGGIMLDDIIESIPNHEKVLKVCHFILWHFIHKNLCASLFSYWIKKLYISLVQWIRRKYYSIMIEHLTCQLRKSFKNFGDQWLSMDLMIAR